MTVIKRKPGRPRGERPPRGNQLNIRLDDGELGKIGQAAARAGKPISTFSREWIMSGLRPDGTKKHK